MGAEIDRLEVKIESQAKAANKELETLARKLGQIGSSLSGINTGSLNNLAKGAKELSASMKGMKDSGVVTGDFSKLAKNISKLATVDSSSLRSTSTSLNAMSRSLKGVETISAGAMQLGELAKNISRLGNKSILNAIDNMPKLASGLTGMMQSLSKAPSVSNNLIQMTNALANLAAQGSKVGAIVNSTNKSSSSVTRMFNNISNSTSKATKGTKSLAMAFGKFYASYFLVIRGIKKLWNAIESSMDYVETFNYWNVTLDKIGKEFGEQFEKHGYDSADSYAESFRDRLKDITKKMTGYEIGASGNLIMTDTSGLGLDPEQLMNYQAKISAVTNSVGLMGHTSIDTAKALSMLSADMSSFTNEDLRTVMTNFQSGLIGQSRALYKYGIDITNATLQTYAYDYGVAKAVSEMTQAEKMQLRLLAILDQSKVAWGDQANTLNSVANQYRILKQQASNLGRTLGNLLLPIVKKVLPVVNGLIIALNRLFTSLGFKMHGGNWLKDLQDGISGGYSSGGLDDMGESAEDASDALDAADKSAKSLKGTLAGFDKLNVISNPSTGEGAGSDGGDKGGSVDLSGAISDALADYESVWDKALADSESKAEEYANKIYKAFKQIWEIAEPTRKAIALLWNDGLKLLGQFSTDTLEDFYKNFLVPVGKWSLADGAGFPRFFNIINQMMEDVDWGALRNALSDLYDKLSFLTIIAFDSLFDFFGYFLAPMATWVFSSALPQLAKILSGFVTDVDWSSIQMSFKRFWKALEPFAEAIGQGIIDFFSDLAKVGAKFINFVVPGGINAIAAALDKLDPRIIKKIGYALGALLTVFIGFKTIKSINVVVTKAWKALYGAEIISGIKSVIRKLVIFADTVPIATKALMGNKNAANALATFYPNLNKKIAGLTSAFSSLKNMITGGDFWVGLNKGISTLRNNMTNLQKGVIVTAAAFAEFNIVKNSFEDITTGSDNVIASIGKIAIAVGAAGAAMYVALGPVGIAMAAVTGIVAAIVGVNKAFEEIQAESAAKSIAEALSNPGGIPLEELTASYTDMVNQIGSSFDSINEKSEALETTKQNAKGASESINMISFALDHGSETAKEKIPELNELFNGLLSDTQSVFEQEYDTIMLGISGSLGDALVDAGYSIDQIVGLMDNLKSGHQQAIDSIKADNEKLSAELEAGTITQEEYYASFTENYKKLADLTGKTDEYANAIGGVSDVAGGIDFSGLINEDLTFNTSLLADNFKTLGSAADEAKGKITSSSDGLTSSLREYLNEAERTGNSEGINILSDAITAEAKNMESATGKVDEQVVAYGNKVQEALLKDIPSVVDNSLRNYEKESWLYKMCVSEGDHVRNDLDEYKTNVIDVAASELKAQYSNLGIEGEIWASEAGGTIIEGLFDSAIDPKYGIDKTAILKENYSSMVKNALDGAAQAIDAESYGKDTVDGYSNGVTQNAETSQSAIQNWMAGLDSSMHDSALDFGSPSKKAERYGEWTVEGYNLGIAQNTSSTVSIINKWFENVTGCFSNLQWETAFSGMLTGMQAKWGQVTSWWSSTAMPSWWSSGVTPWFTLNKWSLLLNNAEKAFKNSWKNIQRQWNTDLSLWWDKSVSPWFKVAKWNTILSNVEKAFAYNWNQISTQWGTNISSWWNNNVIPWFQYNKWISAMSGIETAFHDIFKNAANTAINVINQLVASVNSAMEFDMSWTDPITKQQYSNHVVLAKIQSIPTFASGGFPNTGELFMARENGITEMVGSMGGRAAVANNDQIESGIANAVYPAVYNAIIDAFGSNSNQKAGDVVVQIDGKEVFRATRKEAQNYFRKNGCSPFPV